LMNVGVGVSQVLPTLVMSLLAPPGSTLVLEQPELHLHPRVQSILGDFFLGIAATGKQCLVETHSEHLINRARRRIAEAAGDSVMKLVRMYFVEKPGTVTRIIPVVPNEYGAIPEWPKGFFDEAANEAEKIIDAATRKRQSKLQQQRRALRARGGESQ
jgi:predicted ATPase